MLHHSANIQRQIQKIKSLMKSISKIASNSRMNILQMRWLIIEMDIRRPGIPSIKRRFVTIES